MIIWFKPTIESLGFHNGFKLLLVWYTLVERISPECILGVFKLMDKMHHVMSQCAGSCSNIVCVEEQCVYFID